MREEGEEREVFVEILVGLCSIVGLWKLMDLFPSKLSVLKRHRSPPSLLFPPPLFPGFLLPPELDSRRILNPLTISPVTLGAMELIIWI